jgi:hypothetical protein
MKVKEEISPATIDKTQQDSTRRKPAAKECECVNLQELAQPKKTSRLTEHEKPQF